MEPSVIMTIRLLLAGCVLFVGLSVRTGIRRTIADVRGVGRHALVLGVVNGAVPFWLIAWGEKHVDSGIAAIANATVPIFVALLAIRIRPSERATGSRLAGILIGLVGVGVLAGVDPQGGWWAVAGTLAVVLSSLAYARSNLYTQDNLPTTPAPVIVCAVGLTGGLLMLPAAIVQAPAHFPSAKALGSVVALSVLGTAIASIAHYTMLQRYGSARTSLVAYLIPVTALAYGTAILDEPLALDALLGLALILAGVALGSGLAHLVRRTAPAAAASDVYKI
jgi:drug/metabolite transporter (DMT)-like permease